MALTWEKEIWHTMQFETRGEVGKIQMAGSVKKKMMTLTACTVCKRKKKGSRLKKGSDGGETSKGLYLKGNCRKPV